MVELGGVGESFDRGLIGVDFVGVLDRELRFVGPGVDHVVHVDEEAEEFVATAADIVNVSLVLSDVGSGMVGAVLTW